MNCIFEYERRSIGIDLSQDKIKFLANSSKNIDLALYYLESHLELNERTIEAEKAYDFREFKSREQFIPQPLVFNINELGYFNFNYVLLHSGMKHKFSEIVSRYANFLHKLKDCRKRKVKFLDFDYEILSLIAKLPCFNQFSSNNGFICQFNNGEIGEKVTSIMFHADNFTKGLRKLFGYDSKYRIETNLEDRISI